MTEAEKFKIFKHRIISSNYIVSSKFGNRIHPVSKVVRFHRGIDLAMPIGTPIFAPLDGDVTRVADEPKGYGKWIEIYHGDNLFTRYSHLSQINVKQGDYISSISKSIIALSGNTGASTGPHLHFEIRVGGNSSANVTNPEPYLFPPGTIIIDTKGATESDIVPTPVLNSNKKDIGAGIWQIIDTVIDDEIADKSIIDVSLSTSQGSLLNFIQKVCQKPFVEFFGDTYGDKYYFIARKPPFNQSSFLTLNSIEVNNKDVYSDNLQWNNDNIYSWYQLTPQWNTIAGSDQFVYSQIPAVFFIEYAEIWGSKPLSVVSNYIEFLRYDGDYDKIMQYCLEELRFMIDIHSYLPFTRKGTITIKGNRAIKKGMSIYYIPTGEIFYVDGVTQSFVSASGVLDRVTTLNVSRGMLAKYAVNEIKDKSTISYFNLIDFGDLKNAPPQPVKPPEMTIVLDKLVANFNFNDKDYSIQDVVNNIDVPSAEKRLSLSEFDKNEKRIAKLASMMKQYNFLKIKLTGFTDSFESNPSLALLRAQFIANKIIESYREQFTLNSVELSSLEQRIKVESGVQAIGDQNTLLGRQQNRRVEVQSDNDVDTFKKVDIGKLQSPDKGKWRVNREVFNFFLKRKQMFEDVRK
jgi:hypothetical protein